MDGFARSATPPQRQTPAPTVSRRTPPPTTKRQAEDDEDVPLAKKMKGPGGSGVAANPTVSKSSETSSSKRGEHCLSVSSCSSAPLLTKPGYAAIASLLAGDKQVTPEPRSRKPSSADSGGAITRDQVVALLKKFGKLQTADLIKKLKEAGMKLKVLLSVL